MLFKLVKMLVCKPECNAFEYVYKAKMNKLPVSEVSCFIGNLLNFGSIFTEVNCFHLHWSAVE